MSEQLPLLPLVQLHIERDPATAAQLLKTLDEAEAARVLKVLPASLCVRLFPHLGVTYAAALLQEVPTKVLEAVVKKLEPEQAAAILMGLPEATQKLVMDHLPEKVKAQLQDLLTYPQGSAGRIMSTQFIAFDQDLSVKDAIHRIRTSANRYGASTYTYVIDANDHLLGVLNMRDLMLAPSDAALHEIMDRKVFAVDGFMDREEVARELSTRHFLAAPVIDQDRKLLGIVKLDQLTSEVKEEATENILKMVGAGGDERTDSPLFFSLKKRFTWLNINLATAFLAAAVVALFEDIIAQVTVLAVFLPVVAGQGGNAGAQSLAVVMRGIVLREIRPKQAKKIIIKEMTLGFLNGILIGGITAAIAWMWHGNPFLGVVIGLAMIVNLAAAGLSGAAIPLGMKAMGIDPAQSSSIILTTVTDVVGFFAFLGFAVLFRSHLV